MEHLELDEQQLYRDNKNLMRVKPSGLRVDPLDLQPADVRIEDIAHSLARQCRYNGHVGQYLSVAWHCFQVSLEVEAQGGQIWEQMQGLLHDAAEAYLGDMIRPLKHRPEMQVFRDADARAEAAIYVAFGLPSVASPLVAQADETVTRRELEYDRDHWCGTWFHDEPVFLHRYDVLRGLLARA